MFPQRQEWFNWGNFYCWTLSYHCDLGESYQGWNYPHGILEKSGEGLIERLSLPFTSNCPGTLFDPLSISGKVILVECFEVNFSIFCLHVFWLCSFIHHLSWCILDSRTAGVCFYPNINVLRCSLMLGNICDCSPWNSPPPKWVLSFCYTQQWAICPCVLGCLLQPPGRELPRREAAGVREDSSVLVETVGERTQEVCPVTSV